MRIEPPPHLSPRRHMDMNTLLEMTLSILQPESSCVTALSYRKHSGCLHFTFYPILFTLCGCSVRAFISLGWRYHWNFFLKYYPDTKLVIKRYFLCNYRAKLHKFMASHRRTGTTPPAETYIFHIKCTQHILLCSISIPTGSQAWPIFRWFSW